MFLIVFKQFEIMLKEKSGKGLKATWDKIVEISTGSEGVSPVI